MNSRQMLPGRILEFEGIEYLRDGFWQKTLLAAEGRNQEVRVFYVAVRGNPVPGVRSKTLPSREARKLYLEISSLQDADQLLDKVPMGHTEEAA